MIRWIVSASLRNRYLVLTLAAVLMIYGFSRLRDMPVDVFPEFEPPYVEIQTEALGLSASEIESLVTLNLEEFLSGTPWLNSIRSESVPGMSSIQLVFQPGTDLMRARQVVQESLSMAHTMPNVSKPPIMLQPLSATNRAMMVGLSSKEMSSIEISVLATWMIRPRLMGVSGVANVVIWGQRNRQLQVQVDPRQLKEKGLTQAQIIRTTGDALWYSPLSFLSASVPGTGGWIDTPNQRIGIRHVLPISSPKDLANVPVYGSTFRLGEVAEVVEGHPPLIGDASLHDGPGIILVIEKYPWANTLNVTKDVEDALEAMKAGLPGLEIDTNIFRLANYIESAFSNLKIALIVSTILVALVLSAFLYNWRITLISLLAIPLSLIAAVVVLYLKGVTINIMVLAGLGIAIGAVVDDAIIDVENIIRRLRQQRKEGGSKSLFNIILDASMEVRRPIVYATLIVILAILPVFFMVGVSGAFFQPLAISYALALVASLVVALTVTPVLCMLLLERGTVREEDSPLVKWVKDRYRASLARVVEAPKNTYIAACILILVGSAAWMFLGQSFLPTLKDRELLVEIDGPTGTSQPEMSRITSRISDELRAIPGISKVAVHTGRAITGDEIVGVNSGKIWVSIDDNADHGKTVNAVKEVVSAYPGLDVDVQTYLRENIRDVIAGASEEIVVRLYGPERDVLIKKAEEVRKNLTDIKGLVDLRVEGQLYEPQIEIQVDIAKSRPHGIKPGDVRRASATIFAGLEAGKLYEEQKVFDVVVWGVPQARNSVTDIKELLIDKPDGGHVRLGDIADVKIVASPTVIYHEDISPRIDIVANVLGADLGEVTREVQNRVKTIDFPMEYHPELLGEYAERQASQQKLIAVGIVAAAGIYLLLQACFSSWRLASLAFIALPMALVGGVLATAMGSLTVSLGSLVGLLAVLGIAARNGILLINHYQHLEQDEGMTLGTDLIKRGAEERIAPILMTAATTAFALLPFALLGDRPGLEIEHPMAVAILGGLITATLLNLFVIPPLYLRFGGSGKQAQHIKSNRS